MAMHLDGWRPDVVINTAAYNQVDRCEEERELSWLVNASGPEALARLCAAAQVRLVHYGTDYVFSGEKKAPYSEEDVPAPLNHYGAGKLAGEQAVLRASPSNLVLRTSWLFGWHPLQAKTYVHTVLWAARQGRPLTATTDQVSVPTCAGDLACWTISLLKQDEGGLFHAVNDGGLSRFDWTRAILEEAVRAGILEAQPSVEAVTSAHFNSAMRRPDYTIMSNRKLAAKLGSPLGTWLGGMRKMLAQLR